MEWQRRIRRAVAELGASLEALAEDLIRYPSIGGSPAERDVQGYLADWLERHGLAVTQDVAAIDEALPGFPGMEVPRSAVVRVQGRLRGNGSGPDLLLLGHSDVVPAADPAAYRPARHGDRLTGRGASDMKGGLAAMCIAAAAVAGAGVGLRGDLIVAPVSAEEDGGAGTHALLRHAPALRLAPGSAAVIPEPTDLRVVAANAGCLTFRITLPGRGAHGALRWRGVNPLDGLPSVLSALRDLEDRRSRDPDPLIADWPIPYPISVGTIRGGEWASTVPRSVELSGRYGVRLGESLADARADFEATVAQAAAGHPWLRDHPPEVTWWGAAFESASVPEDSPVIAALAAAGAPARPGAAPYGSDLRLLVRLAGLPAVQYGPGRPEDAHTDRESVQWSQVVACAETLALAAGHFCGVQAVDSGRA